jgi:flagellar biosynthesis protein FlhF
MAMSADSLDAISQQAAPLRAAPVAPAEPPRQQLAARNPAPAADEDDYTVSLSTTKAQTPFRPWHPPVQQAVAPRTEARPALRPLPPRNERAAEDVPSSKQVAETLRSAAAAADIERSARESGSSAEVAHLMSEMQTIKAMLERQLAGFAWGEMSRESPAKAVLHAEMLEAGFSAMLARRLADDMPPDLAVDDGRKWLQGAINRRLRTLANDNDLIDRGGVFALVGPTGVGKTTTTAKLAARCVVRYGADRLALLTTDSYRIGAHEQLKIYGRILGVPVHIVRDSEDLRRTLSDLRDKHMVLIDTVGMSQRDRMVAEQAAMLTRAGEVKRLLLLNATVRGDTLDDVVRAYAGEDLAGCILTKIDEAASLAPALDATVRHGLLLAYVANGQRVPEDLHLPNRNYLLHRAFRQPGETSPHRLREDEIGLVMAPHAAEVRKAGASLV